MSYQTASGVGTGAGAQTSESTSRGLLPRGSHLYNDRQLVGRADAKTMLQSMGVQFPSSASATFWPHSGALIVRNTQDNLDLVDALVDQANVSQPKQVEIESKFVEITQNNLKELGFDWLLGPLTWNGKVFGSGGTAGNGVPVNPANFPFVDPATGSANRPISCDCRKSQRQFCDQRQCARCAFVARSRASGWRRPGNLWFGRRLHGSTISGRRSRAEPEKRRRSSLRAEGDDEERPARHYRSRQRISLSEDIYAAAGSIDQ